MPIQRKQIEGLQGYPAIARPFNRIYPARECIGIMDCYPGDSYASVTKFFLGNMGGGANFIWQIFNIPETKAYNLSISYACGHTNVTEVTLELEAKETLDTAVLTFPVTQGWNDYQIFNFSGTLDLVEGYNRIQGKRGGGSESFNLDYLGISE